MSTFPLFVVEKPGQEGEYRCIADGKAGGQNDCSAPDPVHLPQVDDILPFLIPGGWSAVIDASKFFHMFVTKKGEQKFMGLIHPITGVLYVYERLPMGTSNSLAIAGRFGAAFIRLVMESVEYFQGNPKENTFCNLLEGVDSIPNLVLVLSMSGRGR